MSVTAPYTSPAPPVDVGLFEHLESEVRLYCRSFPTVFHRAKGAELVTERGDRFIDFFSGAGSLNYGHNNEAIKRRVVEYLVEDGLLQGLDMHTVAKREFLAQFDRTVLRPRGLDFKVQFCGPTGTDAVEASLKLARKVTGRRGIVSFSGAYHGMSRGSQAVSASRGARGVTGASAPDVSFVPFEDGPLGRFDSIALLERLLDDPASGVDRPAAVIVEPLQLEGGVYPASRRWLQELRELTRRHDVLLVVDEIQSGCGRTGTFFCFEHAGIVPDIVTVSKSVSGCGLPMSLALFRRELDVWQPGEHTGTFRGNQLAFVAARAACELWEQPEFRTGLARAVAHLDERRTTLASADPDVAVRGLGMVLGIDLGPAGGPERAGRLQRYAFDHGLLVEQCGRGGEVVKVLPPLTIAPPLLDEGLDVLLDGLRAV